MINKQVRLHNEHVSSGQTVQEPLFRRAGKAVASFPYSSKRFCMTEFLWHLPGFYIERADLKSPVPSRTPDHA